MKLDRLPSVIFEYDELLINQDRQTSVHSEPCPNPAMTKRFADDLFEQSDMGSEEEDTIVDQKLATTQ